MKGFAGQDARRLVIAVAIARELQLPVRFVGVGEKLDDLLPFDSAAFTDSLLGA